MKQNRTILYGIMIFCIGIIFLSGCGEKNQIILSTELEEDTISSESIKEEVPKEKEPQKEYYVFLCGAIQNPGVYQVKEGTRLYEVIELAGGFSVDACMDYVNQAEIVTDGAQIKIPTSKEVEQGLYNGTDESAILSETNQQISQLVNINKASESELCTLPGIGSGKAKSIIKYREEVGAFTQIEDIQNVEGIKTGVYEKLKDFISI